jgi:hypothetical protein
MSKRKKYTIIATQLTLYRKEFHAHSQIKALKLAEEKTTNEYFDECLRHWSRHG